MREDLKLMRQAGLEGVSEAVALSQSFAVRIASLNDRLKALIVLASAGTLLALSSTAAYACGGSKAADRLSEFIETAAEFLIAIGGAAALLMFAVGAIMIIFAHNSSRKAKGMDVLKNAVIGLIILGAGLFAKYVIVEFIKGLTGGKNSAECLGKNGAGGG
jgi:hypothetical protein